MGACCGTRADYFIDGDRNISNDKKVINKIYGFNWNQDNTCYLTVEEIIMTQLTNDIGEFVTPHMAHIVFSEFKKFMFLNKIMLEKEKKDDEEKDTQRQIKDYKTSYIGLPAPALIDAVWTILISLKTNYSKS
jgi:hypothetical protein